MTEVPPPAPPNPPYAPDPGAAKNALGIWALVLGILSLICCGFLAGIPAIIVGLASKKAAAQGQANNGGLGQAGLILGIIGTVLSILGIILAVAGVGFMGTAYHEFLEGFNEGFETGTM